MNIERAIELQERAWGFQAEGRLGDARQTCTEALRLMEESEGPDSPDVANLLNDLADIEIDRQDFRAALVSAKRAMEIEAPTQIRARTSELLGTLYRTLGDYARAESHLKQALAMSESAEDLVRARNNLGVLYKYWGRFEDGMRLYREALESTEEESLARATIYHNIGGILFAQGNFAGAEEPARKAWEISRRLLGEDNPQTMLDAAAYAGVLDGLEKYEQSEVIYRRALGIFEKTYGPEHYEVAANLHGLGVVLAVRGALQEAEEHYRRALAIQEKLLGTDSPDAALTRHNLGNMLNRTGRVTEAVPLLESAVAVLEKRLTPGHPYLTLARANLQNASRSFAG